MRARLAAAALLLAPLIVVAELASTAFGAPVPATLALLAVFGLGLGFAAPPEPRFTALGPVAWLVGLFVGAVGLALFLPAVRPLFADPAGGARLWLASLVRPEWALFLPCVGALAFGVGCAVLRGGRFDARDVSRACLLVALVLLGALASRLRVQHLPVLPPDARSLQLVQIAAAVVALLALLRVPSSLGLAALLGAALELRLHGLAVWKLDPATRDMLPLAASAWDAWRGGEPPYAVFQMQRGSVVPLTYLPAMWVAHGVFRPFGDGRVIGLLGDAAVLIAPYWAAGGLGEAKRSDARLALLGLGAVWLASPSVHWNGIYAEPHPWWGVLALLGAAVLRRSWWAAATLLTAGVLMRHFALVLAPFVAIAMWRDLGWRSALLRLGSVGAVGAGLLVHFVARDAPAFWFGGFRWLVEYGPVHQTWFYEKYGFSGSLYRAGQSEWLPRAQVLVVVVGVLSALFTRTPRGTLGVAGFSLLGFICFNGIVWDSFFLDPFVLLLVIASGAGATPFAAANPAWGLPERWIASLRLRALLAALATLALLAPGVWLARSLHLSQRKTGLDAVRARVRVLVKPGDALVDRSVRRLAFVSGEPLFDGRGPTWMGQQLFDRRFGPDGAFASPGVIWVARAGEEVEQRRALLTIAPSALQEWMGAYEVLRFELGKPKWRFSDATRGVSASVSIAGGAPTPVRPGLGSRDPGIAGARRSSCRLPHANAEWLVVEVPPGAELTLVVDRVQLDTPMLLLGNLDEEQQLWGKPGVEVELRIDGGRAARLEVPSRPGPFLRAVAPRGDSAEHRVELVVLADPRAPRRACLDLWRF